MTTAAEFHSLEDLADRGIEVKTTKYDGFVFKMSEKQYGTFKKAIAEHGLQKPITINPNGDILDGHHRLRACQETGKPPHFVVKTFEHEFDERIWVRMINRAQRHLTPFQDCELALAMQPDYEEKAKLNMSLGGKGCKILQPLGSVRKKLAEDSHHSEITLYKVDQILQEARKHPTEYAKLTEDLRKGTIKIHKAYGKVRKAQARVKQAAELEKFAAEKLSFPLPKKWKLFNRDMREPIAEIEDNSIDLIVTDPPFTEDQLHLFEALADFAARKLKPGGSVVFYYGQLNQVKIHRIFDRYEDTLSWYWPITVHHNGHSTKIYSRDIWPQCKPMMWFTKNGKKSQHTNMTDFIESQPPDKDKHPWAQSPVEAKFLIKNLTLDGNATVADPFLGSGAFGIAAVKLDRYFVGIEIDGDTFGKAKLNIDQALTCPLKKEEEE